MLLAAFVMLENIVLIQSRGNNLTVLKDFMLKDKVTANVSHAQLDIHAMILP